MSTIYQTATGKIIISRELSPVQEANILASKPGLAVLPFIVANAALMRINRITFEPELVKPRINAVEYVREERAYLLAYSDWTQASDSPLSEISKAEWAVYRQALRDLPDTIDPDTPVSEIAWPAKP